MILKSSRLVAEFSSLFSHLEQRPVPILAYEPGDSFWQTTLGGCSGTGPPYTNDWLWYLNKIQAPQAWDITKGDPNLKVAIIDEGIDLNHPDLIGKVDPPNDFYTGGAPPVASHGTATSTILAAETVDAGQTGNGGMASIGFNTKIMFAGFFGDISACVYASTVLGARILSISWFHGGLCNDIPCITNLNTPSPNDLAAEKEINDNGTAIIRAAGNGTSRPRECNIKQARNINLPLIYQLYKSCFIYKCTI